MNPELMKFVEWLLRRNIHFTVTSAFRTKEQNEACGGSENSQHLSGDAIDLKPLEFSVDSLVYIIKDSPFKFTLACLHFCMVKAGILDVASSTQSYLSKV